MDKKIVLSNGAIAYRAEYKEQVIEEYKRSYEIALALQQEEMLKKKL